MSSTSIKAFAFLTLIPFCNDYCLTNHLKVCYRKKFTGIFAVIIYFPVVGGGGDTEGGEGDASLSNSAHGYCVRTAISIFSRAVSR